MTFIKKSEVIKKVHIYMRKVRKNGNKINNIPRSLIVNYNNACNFKCDFCYSTETNNQHSKISLPIDAVEKLADEAHELGIWEIVLQGGELTLNKKSLIDLIKAFKPERFQIVLITNGFLLTQDYANELASVGLDCVAVSVSTMNAQMHDKERHVPQAHAHALKALEYAKNAGMAAWPNVIFGHHNAFSKDLEDILNYAKEKDYSTYFLMAMPYGSFKNDVMDAKDMERLKYIRKNYNCFFDTWDMYDTKKEALTGCWSVNRPYISPLGDVLPCPFIPIKIGNIFEQSLKEILEYGFSIKYFGNYSPVCISAFNRDFRNKFLKDDTTVFNYVNAKDIFNENDYIKKEENNV